MQSHTRVERALTAGLVAFAIALSPGTLAQTAAPAQQDYTPSVGQEGKDVIWVPTPQSLVERMLQMAKTTAKDYVVDLGSGDGRTVITAAKKFGATALGIEYNPDMVELSKRNAQKEGVTDKAQFMRADIFQTDFSKATVLTLYLLPSLNVKLRPTILDMRPGTRVVSHAFTMDDWAAGSGRILGGAHRLHVDRAGQGERHVARGRSRGASLRSELHPAIPERRRQREGLEQTGAVFQRQAARRHDHVLDRRRGRRAARLHRPRERQPHRRHGEGRRARTPSRSSSPPAPETPANMAQEVSDVADHRRRHHGRRHFYRVRRERVAGARDESVGSAPATRCRAGCEAGSRSSGQTPGASATCSTYARLDEIDWSRVRLVVEAATEDLPLKQRLFAEIEGLVAADVPIASNTSNFPIGEIGKGLNHRGRVLGLHFFMPAHLVPLVEIVSADATDPEVAQALVALMERLGKAPIWVKKDVPGFVGNRLQHAMLREALYLIDDGICDAEGVDRAVRYGFGFRFIACGPMLQKEMSGWDTNYYVGKALYPSLYKNDEPPRS